MKGLKCVFLQKFQVYSLCLSCIPLFRKSMIYIVIIPCFILNNNLVIIIMHIHIIIISVLLQLTTDIAMGFNQRKPPDQTICVAVDLSAAFDTVCHNNLLLKINRSQLPPATAQWLSCYLRGRQAKTCFRGVKSMSRKVNTDIPQGSKLSTSLFNFYIPDMPRPTESVKRICYADDLTMWGTGVKIQDLEEITTYLKDNSLLISATKSSVMLFSPDPHQANTHKRMLIKDSQLPLVQCPNIFGVYLDTSLSSNKHSCIIQFDSSLLLFKSDTF